MTIKQYGAEALGAAIDENIRLAKHLGELIRDSEDFELLAPVVLSIICFRYVPADLRKQIGSADPSIRQHAEKELDRINNDITVKVQRGGDAYISNATIKGKFALRACITNYRTTENDMPLLLDIIRKTATEV
jgi:glutamate/tyrosine decarboxylase-like PLP-dependent enzyme